MIDNGVPDMPVKPARENPRIGKSVDAEASHLCGRTGMRGDGRR
jgi:hypothetical protein